MRAKKSEAAEEEVGAGECCQHPGCSTVPSFISPGVRAALCRKHDGAQVPEFSFDD